MQEYQCVIFASVLLNAATDVCSYCSLMTAWWGKTAGAPGDWLLVSFTSIFVSYFDGMCSDGNRHVQGCEGSLGDLSRSAALSHTGHCSGAPVTPRFLLCPGGQMAAAELESGGNCLLSALNSRAFGIVLLSPVSCIWTAAPSRSGEAKGTWECCCHRFALAQSCLVPWQRLPHDGGRSASRVGSGWLPLYTPHLPSVPQLHLL